MKIGVFDSGLGGLSVFRQFVTELPEYDYLYLGDNARVPYGGRSPSVIYEFTKNAVDFLFAQDCQLIVLACNTSTAVALKKLQHEYLPKYYPTRRILGVIRPVIEVALEQKHRRIGVMGTRATIAAKSYPAEFAKSDPAIAVFQEPSPLLVPLIEEDEIDWEGCSMLIQKYLRPLLAQQIDGLILGCTHYALIADQVKKLLPAGVEIISQPDACALKLKDYLKLHHEFAIPLSKGRTRSFYATDVNDRFSKLTRIFLGEAYDEASSLQLVHL